MFTNTVGGGTADQWVATKNKQLSFRIFDKAAQDLRHMKTEILFGEAEVPQSGETEQLLLQAISQLEGVAASFQILAIRAKESI